MSEYSRHNIGSRDTDLDTFYTNNRNVRLLLNLLVFSSGLGRPLRCLTLLDDDFHEACCPRILVRTLEAVIKENVFFSPRKQKVTDKMELWE